MKWLQTSDQKYISLISKKYILLISSIIVACLIKVLEVHGHGMIIDPVGRSTRWRYNLSAPINFMDNQLYCGGFSNHHKVNKGKCGICGDNYSDKRPRANELGGKFGEGFIVKTYEKGSVTKIKIKITSNHNGFFYFDLCNMDPLKARGIFMEDDICFNNTVRTIEGKAKYYLPSTEIRMFDVNLQLPYIQCKHCILRWTYTARNQWAECSDGSFQTGCGPQETFRSCADIAIL